MQRVTQVIDFSQNASASSFYEFTNEEPVFLLKWYGFYTYAIVRILSIRMTEEIKRN